jgi:hypothetical protein
VKSSKSQIKNTGGSLSTRLDQIEDRISRLEDKIDVLEHADEAR